MKKKTEQATATLTKSQASMIVALATSGEEWLTKFEIQEQTEGHLSGSAVQRGVKKLVELGILREEKIETKGRGYENYYSLSQHIPLQDGRIRTAMRAGSRDNILKERGDDEEVDEETSIDILDVLNRFLVECPKCHAVLWRKEGVKHCGYVYHADPDLWEQLPNPVKAEEIEEAEEEEEEEENPFLEGTPPALVWDALYGEDEEDEEKAGEEEEEN